MTACSNPTRIHTHTLTHTHNAIPLPRTHRGTGSVLVAPRGANRQRTRDQLARKFLLEHFDQVMPHMRLFQRLLCE